MIAYAARFVWEENGISVTFPHVPEAITSGSDEAEAIEYAVDALATVLTEYIRRRRPLPKARKHSGKSTRYIALLRWPRPKCGFMK